MDDVNNVWDLLEMHLERTNAGDEEDPDPPALAGLLRVLVLLGARLRARLPAYLTHHRAYLDLRCPRISLLPGVLRVLIYAFEGPATTEKLWATGLCQAPEYVRYLYTLRFYGVCCSLMSLSQTALWQKGLRV
jgi:hypothetical protein